MLWTSIISEPLLYYSDRQRRHSGGGSFLGKPVIVLRDTTERPEGIEAGTLKLAGTDEQVIFNMIDELLNNSQEYEKMSKAKNPYGDGFVSKRIADAIIERFTKT